MIEMDELNQQSITGHNLFFALRPASLPYIAQTQEQPRHAENKSQNAGSERG
jgi:hypothetical protein